eukprot:TRINITY_DN17781_c0_g1_i1.p1 TRINITY_DN17781_c0_g1~~TRINITY_DN17781_c0_g1_i1.p1  ORF type:complete len:174 (+),score=19.44 TRINITY_DN17781_c0_g1_i1:60-581(+)
MINNGDRAFPLLKSQPFNINMQEIIFKARMSRELEEMRYYNALRSEYAKRPINSKSPSELPANPVISYGNLYDRGHNLFEEKCSNIGGLHNQLNFKRVAKSTPRSILPKRLEPMKKLSLSQYKFNSRKVKHFVIGSEYTNLSGKIKHKNLLGTELIHEVRKNNNKLKLIISKN